MTWIEYLVSRWQRLRRRPTDYAIIVEQLIKAHGVDKAMDIAVGGADAIGDRELVILDHVGLRDGHYLIDVGCGSGRLTRRVARLPRLRYLGTDVSKSLIDHARATCGRDDFRFVIVDKLLIPEQDGMADFVCFFSVGTHLMFEQTFVYLEEAKRALRPGGRIVLSFLDLRLPAPRNVFQRMVEGTRNGIPTAPINVFFSPDIVRLWADMLGLACVEIVDGNLHKWLPSDRIAPMLGTEMKSGPFGQSVAVLEKPAAAAG